IHTLLGLSKISQKSGDLKQSRAYASRGLALAIKVNALPVLRETWKMLSEISASGGDYKSAYNYYKNYEATKDSLTNKENIFKIAQLQAGLETEKKQAEIEALKKQRQQQAFKRNTIIAGLIALLIIAGLIVSRQRLRIQKDVELGKINEQLVTQAEQLKEQTIRLRELDKIKSTFFANISHEFRTPLTLILNSLSDRISNVKASEDKSELEQLEVMSRNARRLLNLINQLLDLSKLESGHMKLSAENCNLNDLLKVVHNSFSSLSISKQIKFSLAVPNEVILCRLDIDKTEKILYNLLSNAFKFTPVNGRIEVVGKKLDSEIEVAVHNTGPGIPEDQLPHVFNRFYQGKQYYSDEQGTGIGLALTKELVELHGGKILVESDQDRTSFFVRLPLVPVITDEVVFLTTAGKTHYDPALSTAGAGVDQKNYVAEPGPADLERPSVLIVEDSEDLRNYMKRNLAEKYQVIESENGKDGLEKAILFVPDLIITDWMMPEMDGLALCHRLKTDERTSHIPVIMITALASDDAKFQGLETGADDYLTKPFDNRELNIRIRNLVESRKLLRERFSRELHLGPKKVKVSSMDEIFLDKVMQTVETYLGDADFSMEKFGQEVGLSRMQLHRKLKALTGESPGDFLRTTRLKRARQLLESRAGYVSEVAYEVGFNNLSYFSKCYREQFGMAPNEAFSSHVTNPAENVTG
ncbi:MAG TPA: response regulator, partial [Flavitalea sp.]|nr:response regulator [Flavitalea sp.]